MHTIVPFVGLFSVDKGVLVNLFLVLYLIATNGGCGELVAFLVGGLGLYGFFNYLYNGARIRIYLKLLLKTARGYHSRRGLFCTPFPYGARSGELRYESSVDTCSNLFS